MPDQRPSCPNPTGARWRSRLAAALGTAALLVLVPTPGDAQVEPLAIRISDAEGVPGSTVAVVLRTYASRPVSQGRLCGGPRNPAQALGWGSEAPDVGPGTPFSAFHANASRFFASSGVPTSLWTWADATQTLDVDFSSATSSINADDGVLGVFSFTLNSSLLPGAQFDFQIEPMESFLHDPDGQLIPFEIIPGRLRVRDRNSNPSFSIGAPKIHPGSGAEIEIGTAEPFPLSTGHVVLVYDPAIADGLPTVRTDPRHGVVTTTVSYPSAGQVVIDFISPNGSLNAQVPGTLFSVLIPTKRSNLIGSTSWIDLGAGTFLVAPGPNPRPVNLAGDWLVFISRPQIWSDGLEAGSLWTWGRRYP